MSHVFSTVLNERKLTQILIMLFMFIYAVYVYFCSLWGEVKVWLKVEFPFDEMLHFCWYYVLLFRLSSLPLRDVAFQNPCLIDLLVLQNWKQNHRVTRKFVENLKVKIVWKELLSSLYPCLPALWLCQNLLFRHSQDTARFVVGLIDLFL